ncbi:hypothetical protein F7725_009839, partial [Dissostichus mawsoni]
KAKQWKRYRDKNNDDEQSSSCKRCGEKYKPRQCPAYGKMCAKEKVIMQRCASPKEKINGIRCTQLKTQDDSDDLSETLFIKMVSHDENDVSQSPKGTVNAVSDDKWIAPILVNGTIVPFQIDTGAKANLINVNDLKALREKPRSISEKNKPLKAYNGQQLRQKDNADSSKQYSLLFVIVPNGHESLLGDKTSEDLGLVKRIYQINSADILLMSCCRKLCRRQKKTLHYSKWPTILSMVGQKEVVHSSILYGQT